MTAFDVYKTYLALKNHFSKPNYDYIKYSGKTRASIDAFNRRKDKYWYEKLSRQKNDDEIKNFFISNFVHIDDPSRLWIGELSRTGEHSYSEWLKRQQSLKSIFKQDCCELFEEFKLDQIFDCNKSHPILLKRYLSNQLSIETIVVFEKVFNYCKKFDKLLIDPVWETVSLKIKKYSPFLNINVKEYKSILKNILEEG